MSKNLRLAVVVALVFVAGIAVGQLSYPDAEAPAVVLENDHRALTQGGAVIVTLK